MLRLVIARIIAKDRIVLHDDNPHIPPARPVMLRYVIIFFIIALIAGLFGFTDIAAGAAEIARVIFTVFIVVFLVTLALSILR